MPKKMKRLSISKVRDSATGTPVAVFRRKTDPKGPFLSILMAGKKDAAISTRRKKFRRKGDEKLCENLDDSELVKVIIAQNREAYRELFRRYEKKLFSYVYHMVKNKEETEDLLQDIFVKTYKNISSFDTDRKFSSWIYRIAHNETINFLKRKNKKRFISFEDISTSKDKLEASITEDFINDVWVHKEVTKEVDDALAKLPEKYRRVLFLRYFSEYSYEKIALIIKKPINTVGTLINRAKGKLLDIVRKDEEVRKSKVKHIKK